MVLEKLQSDGNFVYQKDQVTEETVETQMKIIEDL